MAQAQKIDPLEAAKLGPNGKPLEPQSAAVDARNSKEQARNLVLIASQTLPNGVPPDSPFKAMTKDDMLAEANRANMPLGPLMGTEELRLVLEYGRRNLAGGVMVASTPVGSKPRDIPPPVPMQALPPKDRSIRGVPDSATNKWRVKAPPQKIVSISGSMVTMRAGSTIELRHYGADGLRSLAQQGVELEAIAEGDED